MLASSYASCDWGSSMTNTKCGFLVTILSRTGLHQGGR